jgi:hypothetical protein
MSCHIYRKTTACCLPQLVRSGVPPYSLCTKRQPRHNVLTHRQLTPTSRHNPGTVHLLPVAYPTFCLGTLFIGSQAVVPHQVHILHIDGIRICLGTSTWLLPYLLAEQPGICTFDSGISYLLPWNPLCRKPSGGLPTKSSRIAPPPQLPVGLPSRLPRVCARRQNFRSSCL